MKYRIDMTWDEDAHVWIAESNDVPGLILEAGSFDALIERVRHALPEMLQLNGDDTKPVDLYFVSERHDRLA